ncbi:uncharacterized protein [Battus philenor]|uniref:uncharacterized protein n=1 Tax=Battus philenor TaxID=42288 RepID=UPI0035CF7448
MPLPGCTNGVVATVLVTLLLLPIQYYVPDFYVKQPVPEIPSLPPSYTSTWPQFSDFPIFDTFLAFSFVSLVFGIYVCDWIQRKLLERRILKLNQEVKDSMDELRDCDLRQKQVEKMLNIVQKATAEYNLLLYLLLKKHRLSPHEPPSANRYFEKTFDDFARDNELEL